MTTISIELPESIFSTLGKKPDEQRFIALGLLQGWVIVIVYTEREDIIRIISARKATKYEQRTYFEQIAN
jgi:uncharacterized DUF497 family protein